jgi:hypothetical protein
LISIERPKFKIMTNAESDPYDFNLLKEKLIDGEENIKT